MLISQHLFITTIKTRSISDFSQCRYVYEEHNSDVTKITVSTILPSTKKTLFSQIQKSHNNHP